MTVDFFSQIFIKLFVVIDPFAVLPMFVVLTRNESLANKNRTAKKACVIAAILLLSFAFAGDQLFNALQISQPALSIAGGFLLLLTAIEMVIARESGVYTTTTDEKEEAIHRDDVSVFPLAIPLIAGPGALTTVVMLMRQAESMGAPSQMAIISMLVIVLLLTYGILRVGDRLMQFLGVIGTNVLTRVFGIILAALAVQIMLNGLTGVIKSFLSG